MDTVPQQIGMTGILLIDIAIGVILSVLTFSLLASALQEAIAGLLNYRGTHLLTGIQRLLGNEELENEILEHPLIYALKGPRNLIQRIAGALAGSAEGNKKDRLPSSIPAASFARALVESLATLRGDLEGLKARGEEKTDEAFELLDRKIDDLKVDHRLRGHLKRLLRKIELEREIPDSALSRAITEEMEAVETALATWFDNAMERVRGWYVRRAKTVLFIAGFALAATVNFDLVSYSQKLIRDDDLRVRVVSMATDTVSHPTLGAIILSDEQALRDVGDQVLATARSFGWDQGYPKTLTEALRMLLSWFLIGLGCTFGGRFWYDLLKSLISMRSRVVKTVTSKP